MRGKSIFTVVVLLMVILNAMQMNAQTTSNSEGKVDGGMMVRIAEIEIFPEYLQEYRSILKTEASASIDIEPGVLAIFPMYEQANPNHFRLVEIYASQVAYQAHLKTPHFLHYKSSTSKMVKSLKLVDMQSLDPSSMKMIFKKIQ